jgi:hypothetical protein
MEEKCIFEEAEPMNQLCKNQKISDEGRMR